MCNCNENGNVYNIGMGCCVPMIANPNAYYTKSEVDEKIASGGSITPQEVDDMIESAITGYATEQWVLDQNYISGVDLSDYATKAEIPTVPTNVSAFNNDVPYLTEHQSLSAYSTTEQMNNAIEQATSGKADSSSVGELDGVVTAHTANTVIHVTSSDKEAWSAKAEISDIPTSNSAFTNDAGYLTSHQSLSAYSTTQEVNNAISSATSGKLDSDVYTAYTAATDVILSGKQGTLTAGRAISIDTANTISFDLPISAGTAISTIIEGNQTSATSYCTHAEGNQSLASGNSSHAEGYLTKANGNSSHAEGRQTKANGNYSHAEGYGTSTWNSYEHASGYFNKPYTASETFGSSGNTLFTIGNSLNGSVGYDSLHNAFEVRQNGDIYIPNTNRTDKTYDTYPMIKLQDVLASLQSQIDELRSQIQ